MTPYGPATVVLPVAGPYVERGEWARQFTVRVSATGRGESGVQGIVTLLPAWRGNRTS